MLHKFKTTVLFWLWLSALVLLLDQVTKIAIDRTFKLYESVAITPFFNLTYTRNTGAAFSFLADSGGWQLWLFSGIALTVVSTLLFWLSRQPKQKLCLNLAYTCIIGGAIGNVIDRIAYGYVIDFLHFYWDVYHYPAFNVADMAICIGAGLMLLDAWSDHKKDMQHKSNTKEVSE